MPSIVLDGTGPSKSSLIEGAYDFCGLSGDQYDRTPEEMHKGLRFLNALMASLKTYRGIDLGYDAARYGEGILEEPSGIPDEAREPVCALLAQRLAPTIGATLSDECKAVLSTATQDLYAHYAASPPSRVPSSRIRTLSRIRRIFPCLGHDETEDTTPVVVTPPSTGGETPPPTVAAPTNTIAPFISGTIQNGQTLTATPGTWTGSPTSYAYNWLRNGTFISGATASTYVLTTADVGALISCSVSASNDGGSASASSNSLGPITPLAPVNTIAPAITGTATQGQTLSVSTGTWDNSPASFAYQWKRGGTNIAGATAATYTLVLADAETTITCAVTATNVTGSGSATSNPVGPIVALPPSNTVAPAISGTTVEGNTLTVSSNGTWTNNPTAFAYQWKRDGANISSATASTYVLVSADIGANVTCVVAAINSGGSATATSNALGPISASGGFGGAGTRAAPTLGYPSPIASNPTSIPVAMAEDAQTGDTLKLAYSTSASISSPTILSHTITDADIAAGTISMGIPTLSGITYFQSLVSTGGVDSANLSNVVAWGDTVAPVISTATSQTVTETTALSIALTATDTGGVPALVSDGVTPGWYIVGGADQLQYEVAIVTGNPVLRWYGNGSQLYSSPADQDGNNSYVVSLGAVDYSGNHATPVSITTAVTQIDRTPAPFTFTNVSNATLSTVYTSDTATISGLEPGFAIAASVSGTGFTYSLNGGAYQAPGSFTVQNGDTLTLRDTSASSNSVTNIATVTVGTYSTTWSVATPGSSATLTLGTGATGAGINRSRYINVASPGYQFIHNANDGGYAKVRATVPVANSKWHAECRLDGNWSGGRIMFGVCDIGTSGTNTDFNPAGSMGLSVPGDSGFSGFGVRFGLGGNQVEWHANGTSGNFNVPTAMGTTDAGDYLIIEGDESTHTYSVYLYDASAGAMANGGAAIGSKTLTTGIPGTSYLFAGGSKGTGSLPGSDAGTVNFGASSFVMTPSTGYTYVA